MKEEPKLIPCLMVAVGCKNPEELKIELTEEEEKEKQILLERILDERNRSLNGKNGS